MKIYISEGIVIGENRETYVKQAAANFLKEEGDDNFERALDFEVKRGEHGKPYFDSPDAPYFSVSDSGQLWVCAVANQEVGIDIQEVKDKDYTDLAKRFFTEEEAEFVRLYGKEGFFLLWTRKEAYVKYKGTGLKEGLSSFSVVKDNAVVYWMEDGDAKCFFKDINFGNGIICTVCSGEPEEAEVRLL
ncbi:MAG: 4'-phosphopantetheinyl transferase superfamily protein [Eubacteriales bacterium]|nr:4'-phosphopantetheinyl transferase superfamily protein [Eubacteriales bacterium]MDD4390023.1 4'-phosphopantetheinyl transferase superfamily protein [Eubacteriales bacterium]